MAGNLSFIWVYNFEEKNWGLPRPICNYPPKKKAQLNLFFPRLLHMPVSQIRSPDGDKNRECQASPDHHHHLTNLKMINDK